MKDKVAIIKNIEWLVISMAIDLISFHYIVLFDAAFEKNAYSCK